MSTIYERAEEGSLTANDLKEPHAVEELATVNPTTLLTPLGVAVWFGHEKQVKLLLEKGANPNGENGARPPLWVAAAKTKHNAGRIIQILLAHKADPSKPSELDQNSTPLLAAVKNDRAPAIISTLVDAGASPEKQNEKGESALAVAEKKKDRDILQAMHPRNDRHGDRFTALFALSGLVLGVVAWSNKFSKWTAAAKAATAVATAGCFIASGAQAIKKRFNMSGWFESRWFPEACTSFPFIELELTVLQRYQEPKPVEEFEQHMSEFIENSKLDRFFPPGDTFLKKVVERAVRLNEDPSNVLNTNDLCRLALYQPYLYLDDSGSMEDYERNEHQREVVKRIASITTRLVPDETGVELRFINEPTTPEMSRPSLDTIDSIMRNLPLNGWSEIGTNLKTKVLNEAVYEPLKNGTFKRPLLVSIITDGHPAGPEGTVEKVDTLEKAILECGETLKKHGYDRTVVRFQISQIGSDDMAGEFLRSLDRDPNLKDVLYCTAERLDDEFRHHQENEARMEQWLLQLLMSPILDADSI
ncbi:uncharacterized protein LTHEOB_10392 [Lasiodiplodia theobromae]|uniref:uncharacterized protein n=1 Tax=Lasiodiplodia theobromae TaxID=45133 RepID=UPI0015C2E711|nr:uncharacterized protein LTHEOB_10392 [Lasiodiplodia theobromae]KAF4539228.1 hypothetical protein LTHEOB_10392 [Lasiodiplodia theobromae]